MTLFVDGTVNQLQDMHLNTLFANLMTLLNLHCLYKDYEHVVIWVQCMLLALIFFEL